MTKRDKFMLYEGEDMAKTFFLLQMTIKKGDFNLTSYIVIIIRRECEFSLMLSLKVRPKSYFIYDQN